MSLYDGITFYAPFDDPTDPLKVVVGSAFTYSRASSATYVDKDTGLISTASTDVLRIEAEGARIEGARTNVLSYSAQFEHTSWEKAGGGAPGTTITQDDSTAPDGTSTADKADYTTAIENSKNVEKGWETGSSIDNRAFSGSVFVKGTKGDTINIVIDYYGAPNNSAYVTQYVLTGEWDRITHTTIFGASTGSTNVMLRIGVRGLHSSSGTAESVWIWGAQLEEGQFASSYIPTTTVAVTRAGDSLTFQTSGNISEDELTVFFSHAKNGLDLVNFNPYSAPLSIGKYYTPSYVSIGGYYSTSFGVVGRFLNDTWELLLTAGGITDIGIPMRSATKMASDKQTWTTYNDGSSAGSLAADVAKTSSWADGIAGIGCTTDQKPSATDVNLNIKNLVIWNRALTDDEMVQVTRIRRPSGPYAGDRRVF